MQIYTKADNEDRGEGMYLAFLKEILVKVFEK